MPTGDTPPPATPNESHEAPRPPSGRADLTRVAILERSIGASLERIWENVLDWEHLPWLHRSSFAAIECLAGGEWGWRAASASRNAPESRFEVELRVMRPPERYVTRTTFGDGPSSEIWTSLEVQGARETAIRVEFWMPSVTEASRDAIGAAMRTLYQQLWDEDEAMMQWRQARLDDPAQPGAPTQLDIGPADAVRADLPRCFGAGRRRVRVVEIDGALHAHVTRCPHMLGPLEECVDDATDAAQVQCPWHGYRFDVRTGRSSDGRALKLPPAPRVRIDPATGHVLLEYAGVPGA